MNHNEVLQKACLIQLATSSWMGTKQLKPETVSKMGDAKWLKGRKHLVDPEIIAPPKRTVARARKYLESQALPFPIKGLTLISKDAIEKVDAELRIFQGEFIDAVAAVESAYYDAREAARAALEPYDLFSDDDYPANVLTKYDFNWQYVTLDVPGKHSILTPEIYQREVAKFEALMRETEHMATMALRYEFQELVDHMLERITKEELTGEPKIFKDTLVTNFRDFFESFKHRNIFEDEELTQIVERSKAILEGVTPDKLRHVEMTRDSVQKAMQQVKEVVDSNLVPLPRRKIRMEQAA